MWLFYYHQQSLETNIQRESPLLVHKRKRARQRLIVFERAPNYCATERLDQCHLQPKISLDPRLTCLGRESNRL